jgi:acetoin utilization protein AcuB
MQDLRISRFMTRPLVTIGPGDTIIAATALMEERDVHHLLVVDGGRMVGILSSADLLKLALMAPNPAETLDIRVREIMQSRVAVLRDTASLREAARALTLGGFHAMPVLAADDTPIGMVSTSDLVALLLEHIDREAPQTASAPAPIKDAAPAALPRLLELLRAADVYLRSGQSDQQHARLVRAVERAREITSGKEPAPGL